MIQDPDREILRLRRLLGTFYRLSSSLELGVVLRKTLETATDLMDATVGSIALIDEQRKRLNFVASTDADAERLKSLSVPLGDGIAGHVASTGESVRVEDVSDDPRFYDRIDRGMGSQTRSYLCVPLVVNDTVIGTAQLMNRRDGSIFAAEDQELMEGFARQAALAIQNARFHELSLRQRAIDSELEVCAEIQQNLFPSVAPEIAGFEILGASTPSRQVGGDYFTYVARPDGSWDLVIADVTGKGLSAALTVSDLHTGLRLLCPAEVPLNNTADRLNDHLGQSLLVGRFVTLFAVRLRPDSDQVEYVVAGHPPPWILSRDGSVRPLRRTGPILGPLDEPYSLGREQLRAGELLVAWTDGFPEAETPGRELLGDDALIAELDGRIDLPLPEIRERLEQLTFRHRQGHPAGDDETLLLVRREP